MKLCPFRRKCDSGDGGCIANSLFCDSKEDCNDGSDEKDCGLYIYLNANNVPMTLAAAVIAIALLFFLDKGIKHYLWHRTLAGPTTKPANQLILKLPSLKDFEQNIPETLSHPTIEMIFFNEECSLFLQLLSVIHLHNLCPQRRHNLLQGFLSHLKKSYQFPDDDTIFIFLRDKFGACSSQTWNLSKNLHDPMFGRENFTH